MDSTAKLKYCPYCMELGNMEGAGNCPHCHHGLENMGNGKEELPVYAVIDSRYMAGKSRKSKEEDFIIYIGLDLTEKRRVWIREFFCRSLAYRKQGSSNIQTYAGQKEAYLEKYDACVRKFQKAGDDKKIAFANGTVYQITPLSEEEENALCQDSDSAEGQSLDHVKNEEGKTLPENRERKNILQNIISSRKAKAAVLAVLAICFVASLLQKYHLGKISAGEKRDAKSASASYQPKETRNPAPTGRGEPSASPVPTDKPARPKAARKSPTSKPSKKPDAKTAKKSSAPEPTKKPGVKAAKKSSAPEPTKKPGAKAVKKSSAPEPTKKPGAKAAKKSAVPEPARKSTKRIKPKKSKKNKSVIDDSSLDKKVYEIE